jgi:hypothetical protein
MHDDSMYDDVTLLVPITKNSTEDVIRDFGTNSVTSSYSKI